MFVMAMLYVIATVSCTIGRAEWRVDLQSLCCNKLLDFK